MPYADPEKQRSYQAAWIARRRSEWFEENGPCVDCGTWERLTLDHQRAADKIDHRVWSWSATRRAEELAKCVARCRPCHDLKTTREGEWAHGVKNGNAKLTDDIIREIRQKRLAGATLRSIAAEYGVHNSHIHYVTRGIKWKHVT